MTRAVLPLLLLAGALAQLAAAGPPSGPPPHAEDPSPPPAWVEAGKTTRWLAFGSYCWSTRPAAAAGARGVCVDMVPPRLRDDIPTLAARPRALLRVHLGFAPTELAVLRGIASTPLPAASDVSVRIRARGTYILTLFARGEPGDASYLLRVRVARR